MLPGMPRVPHLPEDDLRPHGEETSAGHSGGSERQVRSAGTNVIRWEETRLKTLKEVAHHTRVSPRTFLRRFAPHLHPIRPPAGRSERCKLLFDRLELDRLIDKMTGANNANRPSEDDLTFLKSQLEKRLS